LKHQKHTSLHKTGRSAFSREIDYISKVAKTEKEICSLIELALNTLQIRGLKNLQKTQTLARKAEVSPLAGPPRLYLHMVQGWIRTHERLRDRVLSPTPFDQAWRPLHARFRNEECTRSYNNFLSNSCLKCTTLATGVKNSPLSRDSK